LGNQAVNRSRVGLSESRCLLAAHGNAIVLQKGNNGNKKIGCSIAKNYLNEDEIKLFGLLVEQYLAFAETVAQQSIPKYMADWIQQLDVILQLNLPELLNHAGKISHKEALKKSGEEFEKYALAQQAIEKEHSLRGIEEDIKKLEKLN
jgi:hypothetical protein